MNIISLKPGELSFFIENMIKREALIGEISVPLLIKFDSEYLERKTARANLAQLNKVKNAIIYFNAWMRKIDDINLI